MMRAIKVEIHCTHCDRWFSSPVNYEDDVVKNFLLLERNLVSCPDCNYIMVCNRDKMRLSIIDDDTNNS